MLSPVGELTPVVLIDGRVIGKGVRGPVTKSLQEAYRAYTIVAGVPIANLRAGSTPTAPVAAATESLASHPYEKAAH